MSEQKKDLEMDAKALEAEADALLREAEQKEEKQKKAAKEAAGRGIRVYILGIGDPAGAPIPMSGSNQFITDEQGNVVVSKLNEDMCREIAKAGNGSYIYVDNSSSAQEKLSEQVNRLAKAKMESQIYSEFDEQFQGFIILGLIFLLLDIFIMERQNHRIQVSKFLRRKE